MGSQHMQVKNFSHYGTTLGSQIKKSLINKQTNIYSQAERENGKRGGNPIGNGCPKFL